MLGAIFHWDHKQGLEPLGRRTLFQRYDYTCRAFGVDRVVMVDVDKDLDPAPEHIQCVATLPEALTHFDGCVPVVLAQQGSANLVDFDHPQNAVYVVGPDYSSLQVPAEAQSVRVEYPHTGMVLWATVALGIALYDRSVKWR